MSFKIPISGGIPWRIDRLPLAVSTQILLKEAVSQGVADHGYCITAREQTGGIARHGRVWAQGAGNLYASFLIKPYESMAGEIGCFAMMTGLSLHQALAHFMTQKAQQNVQQNVQQDAPPMYLKWPNDIMIGDKKCAGILIESAISTSGRIEYLMIGVGVNITAAPLETAACLAPFCRQIPDAQDVLARLLERVSHNYERMRQEGFAPIREEWLAHSYPKGFKFVVKPDNNPIEGLFETIDAQGHLILKTIPEKNMIRISAGDVFPAWDGDR